MRLSRWIPGLVLTLTAMATGGCDPSPASKSDVAWYPTYPLALEASREQGKPLLIYFQAEWCGICRRLERDTLGDPQVQQALKGWTPVRLDHDRETTLAERFQVPAVPALLLFNREGQVVQRIWGFVEPAALVSALARERGEKPTDA